MKQTILIEIIITQFQYFHAVLPWRGSYRSEHYGSMVTVMKVEIPYNGRA